jgi:AbrB family looped-hinge helix DNA binding protein
MGDRGRLVVPAAIRERLALEPGTPLVVVDSDDGLVVLTREQAKRRVQTELAGPSLVDELLRERRSAAADEGRG